MTNRRDILIIGLLFATLIGFVALAPRLQPQGEPDRPTTYSSGERGALALYAWLRELGYDGQRLEYRAFELGEQDQALVILNPSESIDLAETDAIIAWVERGGTLIFAEDRSGAFGPANTLLRELDIGREVYSDAQWLERAEAVQPVLDQPPVREVPVDTGYVLAPERDDYTPILSADGTPVLVGGQRGAGYVYVSSAAHPFTNAGLRDAASSALVLNLLRRVPPGGRILFDEYHHGRVGQPARGGVLLRSPWGWAAGYSLLVVALYLALSGRRFGRPVPLAAEVARRSSAEYVESMADLFQRGGKRGYVLRHFYQTFKRRLARPAGINPQLDDAAFVRELARARAIDEAELLALLARLRNQRADEAELVRTVADAEELLAREQR